LLVVDLPNGSDFPKPVGNTAIHSLCRLLIHYHTLLLPIHDLKKGGRGWACHFYFARWFRFMLTLLGHIILNKDKEKKLKYAENNCRRPYIK
jgi:hypothetical protein